MTTRSSAASTPGSCAEKDICCCRRVNGMRGGATSPAKSSCLPISSTLSNCTLPTLATTSLRHALKRPSKAGEAPPPSRSSDRSVDIMGLRTQTCVCGCNPPRPCVSTGPKYACTHPQTPGCPEDATPSAQSVWSSTRRTCCRKSLIITSKNTACETGSRATTRSISRTAGISGASCSKMRQELTSSPR